MHHPTAPAPDLWIMRHGETEWSRSGQYTGLTDMPRGGSEQQAVAAGRKLGIQLRHRPDVPAPPGPAERRTGRLSRCRGGSVRPRVGLRGLRGHQQAASSARTPNYLIWTNGVPGGETIAHVAGRADKIVARVLESGLDNVLIVAHGHFSRILTARWLGLDPREGRHFVLGTAKVCTLGWDKKTPAIVRWGL